MGITRRGLLGGAAALGGVGFLTACGNGSGSSTALRVTGYGDQTKLKLRGDTVNAFNAGHKGAKLVFEGTPTAGYWDKLAVQISSGAAPDIINIDPVHISQYGTRHVLAPLDEFIPKTLDVSATDKTLLDQGRLGGKLYGVPVATSTYAMGYDATVLTKLGIPIPDGSWTWDSYATLANDIHRAAGKDFYGCQDAGGDIDSFELYARGRNEELVSADLKHVGFSAGTVADWFGYWDNLRRGGGCVPAGIGAQYVYGDWPNSALAKRKAALEHIMTPNFTGGFQGLTTNTLGLTLPPRATAGGPQQLYPRPSSQMSLSAKCRNLTLGAQFIDWFCNSAEPAKVLKLISGPPASGKQLKALASLQLSAAEKLVLRYTQDSTKLDTSAPPPRPAAVTQISQLLVRTNQDISFRRQTVSAAAGSFVSQSAALLA